MILPEIKIGDREVICTGSIVMSADDVRAEVDCGQGDTFIFEFKYGEGPLSVVSDVLDDGKTKVDISGAIPTHFAFRVQNTIGDEPSVTMNVSVRSHKEVASTARVVHFTVQKAK